MPCAIVAIAAGCQCFEQGTHRSYRRTSGSVGSVDGIGTSTISWVAEKPCSPSCTKWTVPGTKSSWWKLRVSIVMRKVMYS